MDALEAVALMGAHQRRRLVIVDGVGRLVGIVTLEDVLELLTGQLANRATGIAAARDRERVERR